MSNSYLLVFLCATAAAAHEPDLTGADVQAFVQSSMSASGSPANESTNIPQKPAQMIIDDAVDAARQELIGNNTILRAGEADEKTYGYCGNTRDYSRGWNKCNTQLANSRNTCGKYLNWKDCDMACNLCACSTLNSPTSTQTSHCSGHGTCLADCKWKTCTGARCKCNAGYSGAKCEVKDGGGGDACVSGCNGVQRYCTKYRQHCGGCDYCSGSTPPRRRAPIPPRRRAPIPPRRRAPIPPRRRAPIPPRRRAPMAACVSGCNGVQRYCTSHPQHCGGCDYCRGGSTPPRRRAPIPPRRRAPIPPRRRAPIRRRRRVPVPADPKCGWGKFLCLDTTGTEGTTGTNCHDECCYPGKTANGYDKELMETCEAPSSIKGNGWQLKYTNAECDIYIDGEWIGQASKGVRRVTLRDCAAAAKEEKSNWFEFGKAWSGKSGVDYTDDTNGECYLPKDGSKTISWPTSGTRKPTDLGVCKLIEDLEEHLFQVL